MPIKHFESAAPYVPELKTLPSLREAVQQCHGCDLYLRATQAVFGELQSGSTAAKQKISMMMIGEQPGDYEDRQGRPFVGPAGQLLDDCLAEAGIHRSKLYVTNAVKHFKWQARGKRRIHEKPTLQEVKACRPWLDAELNAVSPELIVCLGATAAQSLLGSKFRVTQDRGKLIQLESLPPIIATVHPSSILHARTDDERREQKMSFIADLKIAEHHVQRRG